MGGSQSIENITIFQDEDTISALHFLKSETKLKNLWEKLDLDCCGYITLDSLMNELPHIPGFVKNPNPSGKKQVTNKSENSKASPVLRAFKATCYGSGRIGDNFVEPTEFHLLLRNILFFDRLWSVFDSIDSSNNGAIEIDEFKQGLKRLKIQIDDETTKKVFTEMDGQKDDGHVLFNEFCKSIAQILTPKDSIASLHEKHFDNPPQMPPHKLAKKKRRNKAGLCFTDATQEDFEYHEMATTGLSSMKEFDALENKLRLELNNSNSLQLLWKSFDSNGDGKISLKEVDSLISEKYPLLNNKPALIRAYKNTIHENKFGDDCIVFPNGLKTLIGNIFSFNKLLKVFSDINVSEGRLLDFGEFCRGISRVGICLRIKTAQNEFELMDENDIGKISFDDFCVWIAQQKLSSTLK